jgi:2-methylcitrate dehydratase PrpD
MTRSLTLTLAQYAASTSIRAIPENVRERARQVILDEMASACFGHCLAGELRAVRAPLPCGVIRREREPAEYEVERACISRRGIIVLRSPT